MSFFKFKSCVFSYLFIFLLPLYSNAQSALTDLAYTDPTLRDFKLAKRALNDCEILQEIVLENTNNKNSNLAPLEFFERLQKQGSDGNLLIEDKSCSLSILEFVSSLCSSSSTTNQMYCNRLGFEKLQFEELQNDELAIDELVNDHEDSNYKSFGISAFRDLEAYIANRQEYDVSDIDINGVGTGKTTFSLAGVLFAFTPVKKLKLAKGILVSARAKSVVSKVKPVLSGAMLVLATLGLTNCIFDSPAAPVIETPCTRGEPGYFQLTVSGSNSPNCIKLINPPTVSFLDSEGNVVLDSSSISDHIIEVSFEEPVVFLDIDEYSNLDSNNAVKMTDVRIGNRDLIDIGFDFTTEVSSDDSSFKLIPKANYPAGDYVVNVGKYIKKTDLSKVVASSQRFQYLKEIEKSNPLASFTAPLIPTPCTRSEEGYFELTYDNLTTSCIKLSQTNFTYSTDNKSFLPTHDGDPVTVIQIGFDSKVVYLEDGAFHDLNVQNILKMVSITDSKGVDLARLGGLIDENNISFTQSDSDTVVTISPPSGDRYELGQYVLSVENFARSDDADKVLASNNRLAYFTRVNNEQSFSITTDCARGVVGYFELTNKDNTQDCMKLTSSPVITYLDSNDNLVSDTVAVLDRKIKVSFADRVSFIDLDRYEALTPFFARRMLELNSGGKNLLSSNFGFDVETGIEDEGSYFVLTPKTGYPVGSSYSVEVKNYVSSVDASRVLSAINTSDYLTFIKKEHSSFSTPEDTSTYCKSETLGYFELTNEYGTKDCIQIPNVVFTFTPKYGREMIKSNYDPTATIRIYFDSEVVYLKPNGEYRNITKRDILDMVEISSSKRRSFDFIRPNGPIGLDFLSVHNVGGKTVITIETPYDPKNPRDRNTNVFLYSASGPLDIIVSNFAKKSDVVKIANSGLVGAYLSDTKTYYDGNFGAESFLTSCELEYRPSSSSLGYEHREHRDVEGGSFECKIDEMQSIMKEYEDDMTFAHNVATDSYDEPTSLERADSNTRFVIDVAYIVADSLVETATIDWKGYINELNEETSKMFQDSGVNVELSANILQFSELRQYLHCDHPSIEHLYYKDNGKVYAFVLYELIPAIRSKYPADVFVGIIPNSGAYASFKRTKTDIKKSRWDAVAFIGAEVDGFDRAGDDIYDIKRDLFYDARINAHEIGHILDLHHSVDWLMERGNTLYDLITPGRRTLTGFGYGYSNLKNPPRFSTIMASGWFPLFSSDRELSVSEICSNKDRIDVKYGIGFCGSRYNPDTLIRIGGLYKGVMVDATEASHYTIKTVSEYSDMGVAPLDILTVTNAVTAKERRNNP